MNINTGFPNLDIKSPIMKKIKLKNIPSRISRNKSPQEIGNDFQKRVKKDLIKNHFKVSKAKNRHYDWLAKKGNKKYAVECKASEKAPYSEAELRYYHKAKKEGLIYKVAKKGKTGRIIYKNI